MKNGQVGWDGTDAAGQAATDGARQVPRYLWAVTCFFLPTRSDTSAVRIISLPGCFTTKTAGPPCEGRTWKMVVLPPDIFLTTRPKASGLASTQNRLANRSDLDWGIPARTIFRTNSFFGLAPSVFLDFFWIHEVLITLTLYQREPSLVGRFGNPLIVSGGKGQGARRPQRA